MDREYVSYFEVNNVDSGKVTALFKSGQILARAMSEPNITWGKMV